MNNQPASNRLPSLDGWRAISIAMVIAAHSRHLFGFPEMLVRPVEILTASGNLGVRFFFIISGFLITWLLLCEDQSSPKTGISLKNFYIRRCLRIFPVYFLFLVILAGLQLTGCFQQDVGVWLGNLTFTTNFFGDGRVSGHLWSLAIEEQFYLIWPGLFLYGMLATNLRRSLWFLSLPILLGPLSRIMVCKHYYPAELTWFFGYYPTPSFFDQIALGCGSAILFFRERETLARFFKAQFHRVFLLGLSLIGLPMLMEICHTPARIIALTGSTMQALGCCLLLLESISCPEKACFRFLNWRLTAHLGVLSYSLYIWQQIFCSAQDLGLPPQTWWLAFPGWILPVLVAAHLSYYCLEMPFFRLRKKFRKV